jgi:hypothetical protein
MLEEDQHRACRDHDPWWRTGKENSGGNVNPEGSWEKERTKKDGFDRGGGRISGFDGLMHAESWRQKDLEGKFQITDLTQQ